MAMLTFDSNKTSTLFCRAWLAVVAFMLAGCQAAREGGASHPQLNQDYTFTYADAPDLERLKIAFTSKSKRQICVGRETWPVNGLLTTSAGASTGVYLFAQGHIYAYKDTTEWAYCPQKSCYKPIGQSETIEDYLTYESFGLPKDSYTSPKDLKFKPQPFWCDRGNFWPHKRP